VRLRAEERGRGRGDKVRVVGERVHDGLVAVEESGVVDGTVVMDLAPVAIEVPEDARGAEG